VILNVFFNHGLEIGCGEFLGMVANSGAVPAISIKMENGV
jgi:hypothetical protein